MDLASAALYLRREVDRILTSGAVAELFASEVRR
jgi:hypothetical protein